MLLLKLKALAPCFVFGRYVLAYSQASQNALQQLTTSTASYVNAIAGFNYCGFNLEDDTAAISQHAPIEDGSACPAADAAAAILLATVNNELTAAVNELRGAQPDPQVPDISIVNGFNNFTDALYDLFNNLDLAVCAFVLTPSSITHAVIYPPTDAPASAPFELGTIEGGYNALVATLNSIDTIRLGILDETLRMSMQFFGTNTVSNLVDDGLVAFTTCLVTTPVVILGGFPPGIPKRDVATGRKDHSHNIP